MQTTTTTTMLQTTRRLRRSTTLKVRLPSDRRSIANMSADEGAAHMHELSKLAEKDPEFYKYLQDNDRELLDFDPEDAVDDEDDEEEGDVDMEGETLPILTKDILRGWQKALLDVSTLRLFWPPPMPSPAPFFARLEKTLDRIPFCCIYERGQSIPCLAD